MASPLAASVRRGMELSGNDAQLDELGDTLGLDLERGVGPMVLFGDDFEGGDATLIADLGSTAGNLEGWMLTLPGYTSEELPGGGLLHRFVLNADNEQPDRPVWAAVAEAAGGFRLVASTRERDARDRAAGAGLAGLDDELAPGRLDGERILTARIHRVPEGSVPEGTPGAAALRSITSMDLDLTSGDTLALDLSLDTPSEARARQLRQLLQGFMGMGQMMLSGQPDAEQLAAALAGVDITEQPPGPDGTASVKLNLGVPQADVDAWVVENAMGLPQGEAGF